MVSGDIHKFYRDCMKTDIFPERGVVELGSLAKSKDIIKNGHAGLADLCEATLGKRLPSCF